jgi:hypothetical protein
MTTSTVTPEIVEFAHGVRAALADLPAEEVDDLTEGLEADLAESLAEDLRRTLPDPVAYAAELRAAAGLPGRAKPTKSGPLSGLVQGWRQTRADIAIAVRRNPALASALDFLGSLRPVWWVLRAWLAAWLTAAFFGMQSGYWMDGAWWLVLAAFVVISGQWGRGRWHGSGVPALVAIGNVVAVVAFFPVLAAADSGGEHQYGLGYEDGVNAVTEDTSTDGLAFDGHLLENIYAYDANGKALEDVQLFDVDGNPLVTNRTSEESQMVPAPTRLETGAEVYNVFPLSLTKMIWDENGDFVPEATPDPDKTRAFKNGPFVKVPAVDLPEKVAKSNH